MSTIARAKKSTNVRTQVPGWLKAGMHGLESVWPPLATHVAERLLLTPMRYRTPSRERPLRDAARVLTLPWWPRGQTLVGYTWGSGPPILLVHGWAGRATQLGSFVAPLVAAGHSVIAFDLPAHGRSDGGMVSLFDFRDALVAIGQEHGPFVGVIAHSMGAAATTLACAAGLSTRRLVLVASPASLRDQTRRFAAAIGVSKDIYERVTERIENRLRTSFDTIEIEQIAPRIDAATLVIHDEGDEEIPFECGARIAALLPKARLHRTTGLGHQKILRDPTIVNMVAEFLTGVATPDDVPAIEEPIERELFDREARARR